VDINPFNKIFEEEFLPMKQVLFVLLMCAVSAGTCFAANPTVQILQPSNNASLDWPFTLQATCSSTGTITGWDVYIDGNPNPYYRNTLNSTSLDILVQASLGQHAIQAKCWSGSINGFANITVDVIGGGLIPMPPPNANQFLNLDDLPLSDWQFCAGPKNGCSVVAPSSFSLTDAASPSLDGNSLAAFASGGQYWGILWYHHLGQQDSANNFEVQWSFQVNSGASSQALEFDFPVWDGGRNFYFGTQCNLLGSSKVWQYWNPNTGHWINTNVNCSLSTGTWHTLKWYGTIDHSNNSYTYGAMQIDNQQFNIDANMSAPTTSFGDNFTVQFQLDGNSSGSGYTEYVDEVSAWTW
jgi:hypothetical protein